MSKRFSLVIIFFTFYTCINAQPIKALSIEIGKTGIIFNAYYDHKFSKFGFRLGAGSNFNKYLRATTFGGGGFYLQGKEKNFLEIGADLNYLIVEEISDDQRSFSFIYPDYETKTFLASINLGYRLYTRQLLFRIGISPGVTKNDFIPGGYISLGVIL